MFLPVTNLLEIIMDYKFIKTEYLDSVSGGDPEIIEDLALIFKDQCVEIYNEMLALNSSKDYQSLALLAHKVKSSVAIMGMNDLADMLKIFESQAKEARESKLYNTYISRFKTETDIAIRELEDIVSTRLNKNK